MGSRRLKFGIGIGIILAVVAWEAISGFQESKTYYVTVQELTSGKTARRRLRGGGTVQSDCAQCARQDHQGFKGCILQPGDMSFERWAVPRARPTAQACRRGTQ